LQQPSLNDRDFNAKLACSFKINKKIPYLLQILMPVKVFMLLFPCIRARCDASILRTLDFHVPLHRLVLTHNTAAAFFVAF